MLWIIPKCKKWGSKSAIVQKQARNAYRNDATSLVKGEGLQSKTISIILYAYLEKIQKKKVWKVFYFTYRQVQTALIIRQSLRCHSNVLAYRRLLNRFLLSHDWITSSVWELFICASGPISKIREICIAFCLFLCLICSLLFLYFYNVICFLVFLLTRHFLPSNSVWNGHLFSSLSYFCHRRHPCLWHGT